MRAGSALQAGSLWRGPLRLLALGLLWGLGIAAFEATGLPWSRLERIDVLDFIAGTLAAWSLVGLMVVGYTQVALPRWPPAAVLLGGLALAPLGAYVYYSLLGPSGIGVHYGQVELFASYGYLLWTVLFYSALFIAGSIAAARIETTRRLLAAAEIARRSGEAELDRARLLALRGQIDPALVLDVMAEVRQRYRSDPAGGDRLLDQLVAFLRCAMPAVRSGTSTLHDEVGLVRAWIALKREHDPRGAAWTVSAPERLPDLAFPPLLLLPVLLRLGAGPQALLNLRVTLAPDALTLTIDAPCAGPALEAGLAFQLRVGLQTLHGDAWSLTPCQTAARSSLTLTLPSARFTRHASSGSDAGAFVHPPGELSCLTPPAMTPT